MDAWSIGALLSFLVILACTLVPFHVNPDNYTFRSVWDAVSIGIGPDRTPDIFENILLFLPFGFTLTGHLGRKQLRPSAALLAVLLLSGSISYSIEVLQLFMPERFASLIDVVSNVAGGGLGFLCYGVWTRLDV
jgi:glycopeptide antibiotics resistance protein